MVDQAEIHRKSISDKVEDREEAVDRLSTNFAILPNKESAWQDLIRLTGDEDSFVRSGAADALGAAFSAVPDKDSAWQDLIRLTGDEDSYVRSEAANALGAAFSAISDKGSAWQDLHRLTGDEDSYVRSEAADALGAAFSAIPDKEAAWQDLHRLSGDEDSYVRVSANHSLGRASIFRATEAEGEEEFRKELENALQYFERSAAEAKYSNPAKFCLPFYRSFYSLTCKSEISEGEVEKYLKEAKDASEGSRSKEDLLEAVENLSNV